jgi:hypothetical protein
MLSVLGADDDGADLHELHNRDLHQRDLWLAATCFVLRSVLPLPGPQILLVLRLGAQLQLGSLRGLDMHFEHRLHSDPEQLALLKHPLLNLRAVPDNGDVVHAALHSPRNEPVAVRGRLSEPALPESGCL